jgi:hypothetical protein
MLATPSSPPPPPPSQGALLSIFSEPFIMISLPCQIQAEKASSKPFTFDWTDMLDSTTPTEHVSYSSPPGSPTSVQHVHTYPSVAYEPSHFQAEPTNVSSHTSASLMKNKHFTSSSTESSSTTQIPRSTKSNEKRVSFSSILEIRSHSLILGDHPNCFGGMALECGWDRCEDPEIIDLKTFENASTKRRGSALCLNYSQRLERLQEATGLNGSQLLQMEYERVCGGAAPLILLDQ